MNNRKIFLNIIDNSLKYKKLNFYESDTGIDLRSKINYKLQPQSRCLIPTGLCISFACKFTALICPRSGLANKYGITILNAPGVIDPDFRGEICVILFNTDANNVFFIKKNNRIAQMIFQYNACCEYVFVKKLKPSLRGKKGFGSTGEN